MKFIKMSFQQEFVLLLTCLLLESLTFVKAVTPTYAIASGMHCLECPPGTYVDKDCTELLTNSTCKPCPDLHFSEKHNNRSHCDLCKTGCPKNSEQKQNCTPTTNRECTCLWGFHRHPLDPLDPHWICRPHFKCGTGQGEVFHGNHTHNTECKNCMENQFVNRSDPMHPVCQDCSVCQPGSKVTRNCSLDSNQECSDGNDTSYIVVNSTPPPSEPESDSLGAGGIAAIVAAVLFPILIIVVVVWLFRRRQKKQSPTANVAEAGAVRNGEIPLPQRNSEAGNGVAGLHPAPEESEAATPLLQNSAEDNVTSDWDEEFIIGKVFPILSTNLGSEWSFFIRQLPGWPSASLAHTTTEHKRDEYSTVREMTHACLIEWQRKCMSQEFFTKASILSTLVDDSVKRLDLKEQLERLPTSRGIESPDTAP